MHIFVGSPTRCIVSEYGRDHGCKSLRHSSSPHLSADTDTEPAVPESRLCRLLGFPRKSGRGGGTVDPVRCDGEVAGIRYTHTHTRNINNLATTAMPLPSPFSVFTSPSRVGVVRQVAFLSRVLGLLPPFFVCFSCLCVRPSPRPRHHSPPIFHIISIRFFPSLSLSPSFYVFSILTASFR